MNEVDSMCKNVRSLADDLQVVRECQRHQSQVTHFYFNPQSSTFKSISPPSFFPCPHTHPNWFIILLRLVFTSNEVRLKVRVSKRSHETAYDSVTIKNLSRKQSHKICNGNRVGRIRMFPFFPDFTHDSVAYDLVKTRLSESEAEAEG